MFTVVKLGGVNGSGKTSVARGILRLMDDRETQPVELLSGKKSVVHYGTYNGVDLCVLGKYEAACGGMDTISDKYDRFNLVAESATKGLIVFFEGLITGKTYGALGGLSEQHLNAKVGKWLYAFMDTPFDVAAERVMQRRLAAGNTAPFDPERTMRSTYTSCTRLASYLKGEAVGRNVVRQQPVIMLNHKHTPAKLAKALLAKALEIQHAGF